MFDSLWLIPNDLELFRDQVSRNCEITGLEISPPSGEMRGTFLSKKISQRLSDSQLEDRSSASEIKIRCQHMSSMF